MRLLRLGGSVSEREGVVHSPSLTRRSLDWRLALLLALTLLHGLLYTGVVPPWQHPDEPGHFEHARLIAESKRLPTPADVSIPTRREIAVSMLEFDFWEGMAQPSLDDATVLSGSPIVIYALSQPRLYYIIAGAWLAPWLLLSVEAQLYLLRFLSVLLNVMVVAAVWLGSRRLFPEDECLPFAVAAFLVFQPMYTDMMAAVNNDVLANALAAAFFLSIADVYRRGPRLLTVTLIAGTLVAGILTKTTFVIIFISLPLLFITYPWRSRWLRVTALVAAVVGVLTLLGFMWLTAGDQHSGLASKLAEILGRYFRVDWQATVRALLSPGGEDAPNLAATAVVVSKSFWAAFGWGHVTLPPGLYIVPAIFTAIAILGLLRLALTSGRSHVPWRAGYLSYSLLAVLLAWAAAIVRSLAVQGMGVYLSHGRYVFVAMVPFAFLFTYGILGWIPRSWRSLATALYLLTFAIFDALCFWGYLVPFYYG